MYENAQHIISNLKATENQGVLPFSLPGVLESKVTSAYSSVCSKAMLMSKMITTTQAAL